MKGGDLPVGWVVAPIAELATKVGSGTTPKGGQSAYQTTGTPLIRSMNVVFFGFKEEGLAYINDDQAQLLSNAEVRQGDVLLNITGASIGRVTTAPDWSDGARVNQHVCIIRPSGCLLQSYLSAYLSSPAIQSLILDENYGVTRQALTKQQVLELEIPVPPLNEQQRIAAKLDTTLAVVDACRKRLDGVAAILKRFRQAVLAAATSGELTREWREERGEPSWDTKALGECGAVTGGVTKNSRRNDMTLQKPYLRVANVYRNRLELDDIAVIGVTDSEYLKTVLRAGDLLIVEGNGSLQQVGRVAIWQDESLDCVHQNHLIRWRTYEMEPKWALYWLMSPVGRELLEERAQTSTGLHTLSVSKISGIPIAYPSLSEQKQVIHLVGVLFTLADQLEAKLSAARKSVDRLTPALLAKAFRGELVPQDPNDEPAIELLQRIRAARQAEAAAGKPPRRGRMKAAPYPDQPPLDAAPVAPDLLSGLLQECGALSERALLAASELAPGRFRMQLQTELESGMIYEELAQGERVLVGVNSYPKQHYSCKTY